MKNNLVIEHFEEKLFNEITHKKVSAFNDKFKKQVVKSFKKTNPFVYKKKLHDFFDEVHPY